MKMKFILCCLFVCILSTSFSQYIAVRAKYIGTRLVDDSPNPPKRQNHLILDFYTVSPTGVYSPANLVNYDLYIRPEGLQFGSLMGGVLDSTGNNYPGYPYPAPRAVSYYNTLGLPYTECDTYSATHYVVNGSQFDVGWIGVSYWDIDYGTGNPIECFTAPNIHLPYYDFMHPYYWSPGNLNFSYYELAAGPPYNLFNFHCGGPLQLAMRGLLNYDSSIIITVLPVRFANVRGELRDANATIEWSNMTESDIAVYDVEKSTDGSNWQSVRSFVPVRNDGSRADYNLQTIQTEEQSYYRIKATEISSSIFYSNIIVLRKPPVSPATQEINRQLLIYPNPVTTDQFTFRLTNAAKGRYVSMVVTPDGKQVKQRMIDHSGGDLVRQVETDGLLPGVYRLVIYSTSYKYTQSFTYGY